MTMEIVLLISSWLGVLRFGKLQAGVVGNGTTEDRGRMWKMKLKSPLLLSIDVKINATQGKNTKGLIGFISENGSITEN